MSRSRRRIRLAVAATLLALGYLINASWLARPTSGRPILLAHRGVHQNFACPELRGDTCTATCIAPPTHDYLENTVRSMRAAFDLGAGVVEIDVHSTTDGSFAVFHDQRLDCRTNGTGDTDEHTMAELAALDIGYGYTADGGKSFPFRGRGVGLLPTLTEVLDAFADRRFLIHVKSDDPAEGDRLARAIRGRSAQQRQRLWFYGGERSVLRLLTLVPDLRGMTRSTLRACLARYAGLGWTSYVPDACRNTIILVPKNYAPYLWGWPHRFVARMHGVGSEVFVVGANAGGGWVTGIDSVEELHTLPADYDGGVWTNRIELLGPMVPRR